MLGGFRGSALTRALVHGSVPAHDQARQAAFVAKHLALSLLILASAPIFLVIHGAPSHAQIALFAWAFAPLAAAAVVTQSGNLRLGRAIAFASLIALGYVLALGLGGGVGSALAWLMAAQNEVRFVAPGRFKTVATRIALADAALLIILAVAGLFPREVDNPGDLFCALALVYALLPRGIERGVPAEDAGDRPAWAQLANLLDDIGVVCSASGDVIDVAASEVRLGLRPQDLLQRGLFEHVHVGDRPAFLTAIADAAYTGATTHAQLRLRTRDFMSEPSATQHPRYTPMDLRAQPFVEGETIQVLVVLREAVEGAVTAPSVETQAGPDRLFASMTHELRTPLNAIIGFSEMLASRTLRPSEPEKQREYAKIVHQSGQQLLSLLDTLLDVSKLRSGAFLVAPDAFDVAPLLETCCDAIAPLAEESGVRLEHSCGAELNAVFGDRRICKQILTKLLNNAVKFTPRHGRVAVSAERDADSLVLRVVDTGIGLSAADLARLGGRLIEPAGFTAAAGTSLDNEGMGLGLSLVRGLVDLHGGTILFDSKLGEGTSVEVRLPLDCRAPELAPVGMGAEDHGPTERMKRRA